MSSTRRPGVSACISRDFWIKISIQCCAILSLVPEAVCKASTRAATPYVARLIWARTQSRISSTFRGCPVCCAKVSRGKQTGEKTTRIAASDSLHKINDTHLGIPSLRSFPQLCTVGRNDCLDGRCERLPQLVADCPPVHPGFLIEHHMAGLSLRCTF